MSKPAPGSPAAILDAVVRAVTEGRYRYGILQVLWNRERVALEELADLLNQASAVPVLPPSLDSARVIASGKPQFLPEWLDTPLDREITRICSRLPLEAATPLQLVARIAAAVCIDVSAETLDASARAAHPDEDSAPRHNRIIRLGGPEVIHLDDDTLTEAGPTIPPPSQ